MQSKQQSTEKTGVDVWPNVSLTRAELRLRLRLTISTVLFYFIVSCCVTGMAVLVTNLVLLLLINLI